MVKTGEIRTAAETYNSDAMHVLVERVATEGIDGCIDDDAVLTVKINMRHVALYGNKSPSHQQNLIAALSAIDNGLHPYDDKGALSVLLANAAIADAKLKSGM